ncbi:hypothetical protein Ab1vBOLIVR2_gp98c [Agrobacterium phage OLIVR2]|nr:hypothetical protein Ab1vBOLIVR2_gp98c [Agrobacterium phage OLIVR2]
MKLYIIIALIGAVIFMAAIEYGKHLSTRDAAINAQKQVIIQGKTNDKISNSLLGMPPSMPKSR